MVEDQPDSKRPIQGFRTPPLTSEPQADVAGVRKATANSGGAKMKSPVLWGATGTRNLRFALAIKT
jgi:hypothetical protein